MRNAQEVDSVVGAFNFRPLCHSRPICNLSGGSECAIIVPLRSTSLSFYISVSSLPPCFTMLLRPHLQYTVFPRAFSSNYRCNATLKGTVSNIINEKGVSLWLLVSTVAQTIGKHDGPETRKCVCVKPPFATVSDPNHRLCQVSYHPLYNFVVIPAVGNHFVPRRSSQLYPSLLFPATTLT
jgi:hypothetical protein